MKNVLREAETDDLTFDPKLAAAALMDMDDVMPSAFPEYSRTVSKEPQVQLTKVRWS